MKMRELPIHLLNEISETARTAFEQRGEINIPVLAEEVRSRNASLNIALEDIELAMMQAGRTQRLPMAFDSRN